MTHADGTPSMQQRRATAAEWTAANPVLLDGEMGLEEDTRRFKFGDDAGTAWNDLPYSGGSTDEYLWVQRTSAPDNLSNVFDANTQLTLGATTDLVNGHAYVPKLEIGGSDRPECIVSDPQGWINSSTCDATDYWGFVFPAKYTLTLPAGTYFCVFSIGVNNFPRTSTNSMAAGVDFCTDYSVSPDLVTQSYPIIDLPPAFLRLAVVNTHVSFGDVVILTEARSVVPFMFTTMAPADVTGSRFQVFSFTMQRVTQAT